MYNLSSHSEAAASLYTQLEAELIALAAHRPDKLLSFIDKLSFKEPTTAPKRVAIYADNLTTGGIQGITMSQVGYLIEAGYDVTIIVQTMENVSYTVPQSVNVVLIDGKDLADKLRSFVQILDDSQPDVFIDHHILYNRNWPFYTALAKLRGIRTIGWIYNFALRPVHDRSQLGSFLNEYLSILDDVVVLSRADVTYWKILGHKNVFYLPNPPSPLICNKLGKSDVTLPPDGPINLIWYGRLQQNTKRVLSLVEIAAELRKLTPNFKLAIVGPESEDISYQDLKTRIESHDLSDFITISGEKTGQALVEAIEQAHVFVNTSDIEGYPLVLTEAQSYGLPVVMYELPWLEITKNNGGILQVKQNDAKAAAQQIHKLSSNQDLYSHMSQTSLAAAKQNSSHNFKSLYDQLLRGTLPEAYSPQPLFEDAKLLFEWYNFYILNNL